MSWRIGVDIGGTFTDFAVVGKERSMLWKESSTPQAPECAIEIGLANVAAQLGLDVDQLLGNCGLFVHGSTIAINEILQRSGPTVGLVCTRGFRDVLFLRDGFKPDRYNARLPHPDVFVDRYLRCGVEERTDAMGRVLTPLDEDSVRKVARAFAEHGVESVAVALMWAHVNPAHERRVREILATELPQVPVLLSSDILPETGEFVRTSATVLSSYVSPSSRRYLERLQTMLVAAGLRSPLLLMRLNGGCSTVEHTLQFPINTIGSGPAAAPGAAIRVADRVPARDLIVIDMGGTSFDVCLVKDRTLPQSRSLTVADQPLGAPGVEIHSIGAGGGSIAWIDSGGSLRVGLRSAGAEPGPVAYGLGGREPTVTDANVVLGYLSSTDFLGGRRSLDRDAAEEAIRTRIAAPLGLGLTVAAAGITRVVNDSMVNAIRVVSVQRGIDPKPFLLVAGGGAGPLHAGRLAAELGIAKVLIPAEAGTISAFGMTVADVRHDYVRALHAVSNAPQAAVIDDLLGELETTARDVLRADGFPDECIALERFVDARYRGQVHELMASVPDGTIDDSAFSVIATGFHQLHREWYGWMRRDYPVEYLHWRVRARGSFGHVPERAFEFDPCAAGPPPAAGSRQAYFDEFADYRETPVFRAEHLPPRARINGPALVDGSTTTIVVFPDQWLWADGEGSFLLETAPGVTARSSLVSTADAKPDDV